MSVIDKLLNTIGMSDDSDEVIDEYGDYDEDPVQTNISAKSAVSDEYEEPQSNPGRVRNFAKPVTNKNKQRTIVNDLSVCVFKPTSVDESHEIMSTFRENRTVVLNLEEADAQTAQRILDFASGCAYALDGSLQKISNYIFIVTPSSVEISGDFQDTLSSSFNQY